MRYRRTPRGCRMVRSHSAAGAAITGNGLPPCCRQGHRSRRPRGHRSRHRRPPPHSGHADPLRAAANDSIIGVPGIFFPKNPEGTAPCCPGQFFHSHGWHTEAVGSVAQICCVSCRSCCVYRVMANSASRAPRISQMLMRIRADLPSHCR
jgi:hypothetical protein